jgi:hypothetical protein
MNCLSRSRCVRRTSWLYRRCSCETKTWKISSQANWFWGNASHCSGIRRQTLPQSRTSGLFFLEEVIKSCCAKETKSHQGCRSCMQVLGSWWPLCCLLGFMCRSVSGITLRRMTFFDDCVDECWLCELLLSHEICPNSEQFSCFQEYPVFFWKFQPIVMLKNSN